MIKLLKLFFTIFIFQLLGLNIFHDIKCNDNEYLLGGNNENIDVNLELSGKNLDNYIYFKKCILQQVDLKKADYERINVLKDYIDEIEEKNKHLGKKYKINIDREKQEFKTLCKKLILRDLKEIILVNILEKSNHIKNLSNIECPFTVKDLHSLRILESDKNDFLLSKIIKCKCNLSKIIGYFKSICPDKDINTTQDIVKILCTKDTTDIENLYNDLSLFENSFLNLYSYKNAYKRFKLKDEKFNVYADFRHNKVKYTNQLNLKHLHMWLNSYSVSAFIIGFLWLGIAPMNFLKTLAYPFGYKFDDIYGGRICNIFKNIKERNIITFFPLFGSLLQYFLIYKTITIGHQYFNPKNFYKILGKRFKKIKEYYVKLKNIYDKIQCDDVLYNALKDRIKHCRNLFVDKENFNKEQKELLYLMEVIPKNWSYWKCWGKGSARKLCKFFYLFDKYKDMFIDPMIEIAELETYLSLSKLLKDEKYKDKICIPEISDKSTAVLIADNAWNPFLDVDKAVPNNIRLGREVSDDFYTIIDKDGNKKSKVIKNGYSIGILHGMNAGGKTTMLETIALLYFTYKCYGFSFAKNVEMTNFKKLYTMIDITTDISKNYSKYMSEVVSCDNLLEEINHVNRIEDSILLISDELFSGTNPEAAGKLLTNLLKNIVKNKYVVSIFSTHNKKPTELEKTNNLFRNLYMLVENKNDDIQYKYKVMYGYNDGNLAENLIHYMKKKNIIKNSDMMLKS